MIDLINLSIEMDGMTRTWIEETKRGFNRWNYNGYKKTFEGFYSNKEELLLDLERERVLPYINRDLVRALIKEQTDLTEVGEIIPVYSWENLLDNSALIEEKGNICLVIYNHRQINKILKL